MEHPIFITGGSGTLGTALLMWLEHQADRPRATVFARDESKLATTRLRFPWVRTVIGDIRDYERLELAMSGHPTVMHFAALKRIPEAEDHPYECVMTNILGSMNVAQAALRTGAEHLVGISTDKACRAITNYGASKRSMESIFRTYGGLLKTTLVRYGNVVSSRGSVIPIWKEQLAQHQKVTITDKRCTRFWMSPISAIELIIFAMGEPSGSLVVPFMRSANLMEMAQSFLEIDESAIEETGLRSLEKLHEDLISPDEPGEEIDGRHFNITGQGVRHPYSSDDAPRLEKLDFEWMLADAEEVERGS